MFFSPPFTMLFLFPNSKSETDTYLRIIKLINLEYMSIYTLLFVINYSMKHERSFDDYHDNIAVN